MVEAVILLFFTANEDIVLCANKTEGIVVNARCYMYQ